MEIDYNSPLLWIINERVLAREVENEWANEKSSKLCSVNAQIGIYCPATGRSIETQPMATFENEEEICVSAASGDHITDMDSD